MGKYSLLRWSGVSQVSVPTSTSAWVECIRFSTSACLILIEWKLTLTRRSGLFTLLGLRLCLGVGDEAASGGPGLPSMLRIELSSWRLEKEFDVRGMSSQRVLPYSW